jgi:hypothetical protein
MHLQEGVGRREKGGLEATGLALQDPAEMFSWWTDVVGCCWFLA